MKRFLPTILIATAALAMVLAISLFPQRTVAEEPLEQVTTLAQWNALAKITPYEPVLVLFVRENGTHLERMLQIVASESEFRGEVKIVKILIGDTPKEVLAAAGDCSTEIASSNVETDTVSCSEMFEVAPVRLVHYQGRIAAQSLSGDALSLKEVEQSTRADIGHRGQDI